jgi:hypothetical protein
MSSRSDPTAERTDTGTDLRRLLTELADDGAGGDPDAPCQAAGGLFAAALDSYGVPDEFAIDEPTVKADLGELLLTLVAGRSTEANGKHLMDDLTQVFGADLSPGTVYPQLHDLEETGLLECHELVRTKEYHLDDEDACREQIADRMRQHLVLGLFYHRALEEF